jgi:N-methylhydantoinase A
MGLEEAAVAALIIANENIVGAIRELTIAQGIDPRELTVVAGGGAGGLNIIPIARELGCRKVLLPSTASALSACGALYSDIVREFPRAAYADTGAFEFDRVNATLEELEQEARAYLDDLEDLSPRQTRLEYLVEARYRGQVWELDVPLGIERFNSEADVQLLEEAFHETHERVFAVREPGQHLECLLWKVRAIALLDKPRPRPRELPERESRTPAQAAAYFPETGAVSVDRFDGSALPRGSNVQGPAIIREPNTTVVLYPDSSATVTELGNYLLDVGTAGQLAQVGPTDTTKEVSTW